MVVDKLQRLVVTLLIVTVILSIVSIVINIMLLNIDLNRDDSSRLGGISSSGAGGLSLIVESPPANPAEVLNGGI